MSKDPGQPFMVTNWRTGKVSLRMVIGAGEQTFEFTAVPDDVIAAMRAGKINGPSRGVEVLSEELEEFLKALGYTPFATEHKT